VCVAYPGSSGVVPYCSLMVHKLVHVLSIASLSLLWYLVFSGGSLLYSLPLVCHCVMAAGVIFFVSLTKHHFFHLLVLGVWFPSIFIMQYVIDSGCFHMCFVCECTFFHKLHCLTFFSPPFCQNL